MQATLLTTRVISTESLMDISESQISHLEQNQIFIIEDR